MRAGGVLCGRACFFGAQKWGHFLTPCGASVSFFLLIFIGYLCVRCPWVLVYPLGVPEEWFLWWACKPEIHLALIFFTDPLQKLNQNWAHVWHQTRAKVESKVGPRLAPKAGTPRFGQATEKNSGSPKCSQKCTPFSHEKIRTPKPGFRYPCVKNVCPVQDRHLAGF